MAISEIKKPVGEWCPHCKPGAGGCQIYEKRPTSCHDFACFWLAGVMPEDARPDKIRAMLTMADPENSNVITMWVDSIERMTKEARAAADNLVKAGHIVVLAEGKAKRKAMLPADMMEDLVQIVEKSYDGKEVVHEVPIFNR